MKQNLLVLVLLIFSSISCVKQEQKKEQIRATGQVLDVIMHRGVTVNQIAPANSLDAIALTSRVGATTVEFDIKTTKDGQIVLMHDDVLTNEFFRHAEDYSLLTNETISPKSMTLEEFRTKYVQRAKDPSMRRYVPTLEEALKLCKLKNIRPFIEIKSGFSLDLIEKAYTQAVSVMGKGNFTFTSLGPWVVEHLRSLDAELELSCDPVQNIVILKKMRWSYCPYYKEVDEEIVAEAHKNGLRAYIWTVPREDFDLIIDKNLDGIMTDNIAPMYNREYSIFADYSDGKFLNYQHDGVIENNILHLFKDQSVVLKNTSLDSLYLGGLYFDIEFKGKIKIEAIDFAVDREYEGGDYKRIPFQFLFHDQKPSLKITALNDSTQIKSIWVAVNKF